MSQHEECPHTHTLQTDDGMMVCDICGEETQTYDNGREWRYYPSSRGADPARCHKGRDSKRRLKMDFVKARFNPPASYLAEIEDRYNKVITERDEDGNEIFDEHGRPKYRTVRGKNSRVAIIAACTFFTYRSMGQPRPSDYFQREFDIDKKAMSKGIHEYYAAFPMERTVQIQPENLMNWYMDRMGIDKKDLLKLQKLVKQYVGTSRRFKNAPPQAAAAAVLYNWAKNNDCSLSKKTFANRLFLSDTSISDLLTSITEIEGAC